MVLLLGFRLVVLEADGDTSCVEYGAADNTKNSRGLISHHSPRPSLYRFSFRITLNNNEYQWHNANALILRNFDNRYYNLEEFILWDSDCSLKSQQFHVLKSHGGGRLYSSNMIRLKHRLRKD